jgi:hypothetical protein
MQNAQVIVEYKFIAACRHDGPNRWCAMVFTRSDDARPYKKLVNVWEVNGKAAALKKLQAHVATQNFNIVTELDLTPDQVEMF